MGKSPVSSNRRGFIKKAATVTTGLVGISLFSSNCWSKDVADEGINVIGPKEGFSPQVGTLVSMMNWMRETILRPVQNMSVEQLDYLHDSKSNSIGAMLLHLAATERYYQLHTFEGKKWGSWDENIKTQWDLPMNLGEAARKTIKGRNLDYYLNALKEVRQSTLLEFQRRDDRWLMAVDKEWGWGPTNNYCKWFHVCEHESNHNGQIKWIKSRLPGAKSSGD
ncbi:MAG TPA: DinB family protein [Flavisolibacter sp.]|nr:DinB family protein [Flavisolibacter sp.]